MKGRRGGLKGHLHHMQRAPPLVPATTQHAHAHADTRTQIHTDTHIRTHTHRQAQPAVRPLRPAHLRGLQLVYLRQRQRRQRPPQPLPHQVQVELQPQHAREHCGGAHARARVRGFARTCFAVRVWWVWGIWAGTPQRRRTLRGCVCGSGVSLCRALPCTRKCCVRACVCGVGVSWCRI